MHLYNYHVHTVHLYNYHVHTVHLDNYHVHTVHLDNYHYIPCILIIFMYILCILIIIKILFLSPTDAQLNSLKNNIKIYIKLTLKGSYMFRCKHHLQGAHCSALPEDGVYTETCRNPLMSILM